MGNLGFWLMPLAAAAGWGAGWWMAGGWAARNRRRTYRAESIVQENIERYGSDRPQQEVKW